MIRPRMRQNLDKFPARMWQSLRKIIRWLKPGMGVKRWLLVILLGTTLVGVGLALFLLDLYRNAPDNALLPVVSAVALQSFERPLRIAIFGGAGLLVLGFGIWGLNHSLLQPFTASGRTLLDTVTAYRKRERGPRVVALGGGTGLSTLLRGVKAYTSNLTAIVTVADDGGSSGELRKSTGILPPGDIRNCLAALSNDEALLSQIFQYRFAASAGLNGHTLGNLFITALAEITGSFEEAVAESGRVLAVQGRVMPATLHDVKLVADVRLRGQAKDIQVKGESQISQAGGQIKRVWLEPGSPLAFPPTLQAILSADLIVVGPGSLYTSLLPNLLVPDLVEALRVSRALKFYVCNVATQRGETDGYTCGDHIRAVEKVTGRVFDLLICNKRTDIKLPEGTGWVTAEPDLENKYAVYFADVVDESMPWRHDSKKLAQVITDLYYERTGPLANRDEG